MIGTDPLTMDSVSSSRTAQTVVEQLDSVIAAYRSAKESGHPDDGRLDEDEARFLLTRAWAAIERTAPPGSPYLREASNVIENETRWIGWRAGRLIAIVRALREDYDVGAMQSVAELVHADLFVTCLIWPRNSSTSALPARQP